MKEEIIQLLKDFYSDRDLFNQRKQTLDELGITNSFESTMEIYEKHAKRIYERLLEKCEGTAIGEECGKPKIEGGDFCQFHSDNLPI